jgi:Ca2+-transporting ATPase
VVESYAGGKKTDTEQLPATITSLVVEGISQNTTGSIFVPEVSF